MSHVKRITAVIRTGNRNKGGTDGWVYLGIGGREFSLSRSDIDDFVQGKKDEYILGAGATVEDADLNDPRFPEIQFVDLAVYPVYIRFDPKNNKDEWDLELAEVTAEGSKPGDVAQKYTGMKGGSHLWLGQRMGTVCYLKKV